MKKILTIYFPVLKSWIKQLRVAKISLPFVIKMIKYFVMLAFISLITESYAQEDPTTVATTVVSAAAAPQPPTSSANIVPVDLQQRMIMLKKMMESQTVPQPTQPGQNVATPAATQNAPAAVDNTAPIQTPVAPQTQQVVAPTAPAQPQQQQVSPITPPPQNNGLYDDAFSGVVTQMLPMTPDQIAKLRLIFNETQKAAATPPGTPPKPTTSSLLVNLSPESAPPVIKLGAGYITSLVFMDSTGQPWPITAYSIGDPTAFNIQWDKVGNTLLIQAASYYKRSNLAVILKGLNTPVMLTLLSGQEAVDYRVDLRIPGLGPNAIVVENGLPDSANPVLLDVLNGIPPKGSKTLKVEGGDCQAWLVGDKMFLRTTLDVISPAWKSVMSSIDGTHAYELQRAPVVLALQRGKDKTLILSIEGFE